MSYHRQSKVLSAPRRLSEQRREQIAGEIAKYMADRVSAGERRPKLAWLGIIGIGFGKAFATAGAVVAALALVLGFEQYRWSREHASRSILADQSTERQMFEQAHVGQCMVIVDFLYGQPRFSSQAVAERFVAQLSQHEETCIGVGVDLAVARSDFVLRQPQLFAPDVVTAAARVRRERHPPARPARIASDLQLSEGFASLERFIVEAGIPQRDFAPAAVRYPPAEQAAQDGNASALSAEPPTD